MIAVEGFLEPAARFGVQLLNRLFGVADGIEQVLPLRVQEVVALLGFLKFFERLRIHGAQRLDLRADFLIALLRLPPRRLRRARRLRADAHLGRGGVQLLAAGFIQVFQIGLFLDQLQLDLRALFLRGLRFHAQRS